VCVCVCVLCVCVCVCVCLRQGVHVSVLCVCVRMSGNHRVALFHSLPLVQVHLLPPGLLDGLVDFLGHSQPVPFVAADGELITVGESL
jgi:hypothetical protein